MQAIPRVRAIAYSHFLRFRDGLHPLAVPQRLLRKASHAISPHSVFMAVRNCFLAPSKAPNPSQRLEQCLRDYFGRPLTPSHLVHCALCFYGRPTLLLGTLVPQRLLWKASHAISPPALCFYDRPKLLFGTAPVAVPSLQFQASASSVRFLALPSLGVQAIPWVRAVAYSRFLQFRDVLHPRAAHDASFANPYPSKRLQPPNPSQRLQQCLRHCFGRLLTPSHLVPWPHSVCMAVRNCLLAPPSQRLEQCLRDCFGSLTPSAPPALPQTLLRKASHAISPRALAALCLYGSPKLPFGTLKGS